MFIADLVPMLVGGGWNAYL